MISTTMQSILQGIGKLNVPVRNLAIGCIVKLILNLVLISIPSLNIYGAILGTIFADLFVCILDFSSVKKFTFMKSKGLFSSFIKTMFCAMIMGIACILVKNIFIGILGNAITTVLCILVSAIVYFVLILYTKTLNILEVKNLVGR